MARTFSRIRDKRKQKSTYNYTRHIYFRDMCEERIVPNQLTWGRTNGFIDSPYSHDGSMSCLAYVMRSWPGSNAYYLRGNDDESKRDSFDVSETFPDGSTLGNIIALVHGRYTGTT